MIEAISLGVFCGDVSRRIESSLRNVSLEFLSPVGHLFQSEHSPIHPYANRLSGGCSTKVYEAVHICVE